MTSLKRIEVRGPGALAFLQRLTTNNLDRRVGSVVYTLLLEEHGGIRSDLTIARLETDLFQVGANGQLDLDWFERHAPTDGSVEIRDVPGLGRARQNACPDELVGRDFRVDRVEVDAL